MGTSPRTYRSTQKERIKAFLLESVSAAPLASFRFLYGLVMAFAMARFVIKGWVSDVYLEPMFFFRWEGFEWLPSLGPIGLYGLFALLFVASILIMLGWRTRIAAAVFATGFIYLEVLDKSTYLNHYYLVSLISVLLIFLPSDSTFSLNAEAKPRARIPRWQALIIPVQLALVYFFAGLAKVQPTWLLEAQPLKLWLFAHHHQPLIGGLLSKPETAYLFSWFGAFYDLTIVGWLLWSRTRWFAFSAVVIFHVLTAWLFPIGIFPWFMIAAATVFLGKEVHERAQDFLRTSFRPESHPETFNTGVATLPSGFFTRLAPALVILWFAAQTLLPMRYLAYDNELFWSEEGYRFSWRVMLMEKSGYVTFYVQDPETGARSAIRASDYLTPNQEKMMATQPDMIRQFAGFLAAEFEPDIPGAEVYADSWVSLNGTGSKRFIDPSINLAALRVNAWASRDWVLPYSKLDAQID